MADASSSVPQAHGRFDYSAIVDRKKLDWPNGARVAVWVIPNIEHFLFDRPSTSVSSATVGLRPDVLNYSWRDFGVRVGVWRMMEIMEHYGVKGTVALNADVCRHYPRIIEAGNALGWEWMGHGRNNSILLNAQPEADERALVRDVVETIAQATGKRPRGWLGPALSESVRTLDLLAECGIEYVGDWVNDEQPYPMRVASGTMLSLPYSIELNDITNFLERKRTGEEFARVLCDQFDQLYEDGAVTGRVMAIPLHPFLIGHAHRARHFARALAHITARREVWVTTGAEIADWYRRHYLA
ncbi:MAG TPA: polysaccharide deacetylase family protein [Stellaceae bacterium]|nr:polysaccharide deacetylase family protein [Stellaceae bacterium]